MANSQNVIAWAQEIEDKYGAKISRLLGVPVGDVTYVVDQGSDAPAHTTGNVITIGANWLQRTPEEAVGALIHELAHAYAVNRGGAEGERNNAESEALAEYARAKLDPNGWNPDDRLAQHYLNMQPAEVRQISQRYATTDTATTARTTSTSDNPFGGGGDSGTTTAVTPLTAMQMSNMTQAQIDAYYASGSGTNPFGTGNDGNGNGDGDRRAAAKAELARKNVRTSYLTQLQLWGIPMTADLRTLVQHASQNGYTNDRFLFFLRQTDEYQKAFPGIFNDDGTLKMDEATYTATKQEYEDSASSAGLNMGPNKIGWLFEHDVSSNEFADRAPGIRMLKDNHELYVQFGRALVQSGNATPAEVKDEGLLKFVLGEAPAAWYEEYHLAETRYAATQAGISLARHATGAYDHISPGQIEKIADKGLTPEAMKAGFEQTAQDLLTTLPLSRIQKYGLTKRDILQARFGGKKQAEVLQKMEHIKSQEEAFYKDRASAQIYATAQGVESLGGSGTKAAQ